jgi:hypothetical protein
MQQQFKLYSVDTKAFYTEEEIELNKKKFKIRNEMKKYEQWQEYKIIHNAEDVLFEEYHENLDRFCELKKLEHKQPTEETEFNELKQFFKKPKKQKVKSKNYRTSLEKLKEKENNEIKLNKRVKKELSDNEEYVLLRRELGKLNKEFSEKLNETKNRQLNNRALTPYNQITLFENALSRAMDIKSDELVIDMVLVRVYHYRVLQQLIENGFTYTNEEGIEKKYRVFTASAGQIRTKKVIFIEESRWYKYEKKLMCGLTINDINNSSEHGCNINKFLAYLALCNSATDELEGFDIDRSIVIDDFETLVKGEVDYIDNKTFEVTRKIMDIPIPHSDGCGWVLNSKKNFMIRLPWVKGLMTVVDYIKFCDKYRNGNYKIIDIYGKEWDLKENNIEYVFSKSQFKMYKYYKSWDDYKDKYKENKCRANYCNLEPDTKQFRKACFNYQMWQTLTDITDEEIETFTDRVDDFITKGYTDRKTMLNMLGADSLNNNKTYLQQCIEIYPEMIRDYHVREELASSLNARKKEAKYGKFKINGTYTFLLPDVFAWMQYVFLDYKIPQGILKEGQVSCRLFKESNELLVNRSPHLYREHAVRDNIVDDITKEWFVTNGVYTSSHDLISKILQFDNDGDKALVIADGLLINIAKRNMEGIVPLYYEMGKAKAENINKSNIYNSLTKAFKFNNIGKFSNQLTVMWNLKDSDKKLETIAQITALNNFTIDGAKTLLVPEVPKDVELKMKESNSKMPYFFQFAKDKDKDDVADINDSTVNRICRNIEAIKQGNYDFSSIGKFNKNMLMNNCRIEINDNIINTYKELEKNKRDYAIKSNILSLESYEEDKIDLNYNIRKSFCNICDINNISLKDGIDMVIRYVYSKNKNSKKDFLFNIFGDVILNNIKNNIKKPLGNEYIMCGCCGERVSKKVNNQQYCEKCAKNIQKEQIKIWKTENKGKSRNKI